MSQDTSQDVMFVVGPNCFQHEPRDGIENDQKTEYLPFSLPEAIEPRQQRSQQQGVDQAQQLCRPDGRRSLRCSQLEQVRLQILVGLAAFGRPQSCVFVGVETLRDRPAPQLEIVPQLRKIQLPVAVTIK